VLTIGQAKHKAEALAGLERWKARHPAVAAQLPPPAFLVDTMRGRSSAWFRVRVNVETIPEAERPPAEPLDPAWDPAEEWAGAHGPDEAET